jgi:hypothetical protein
MKPIAAKHSHGPRGTGQHLYSILNWLEQPAVVTFQFVKTLSDAIPGEAASALSPQLKACLSRYSSLPLVLQAV